MIMDIAATARETGVKAASKAAVLLLTAVKEKGRARLMLATGQSHFEFYEELLKHPLPWDKVEIFHLDEYIGIPASHKASFRRYLQTRFLDHITPGTVHLIEADRPAAEVLAELEREVTKEPIDVGIVGIGNNGHIAFNDPPADFAAKEAYRIVELDEACRLQQVNEGWFPDLPSVPATAVSATVSLIVSFRAIVSVVPHQAKAQAVKNTLASPEITNLVPSTILRTHPNWFLFLDEESASMLDPQQKIST
ncbi:MAG: glucosamine-6-phosphate deaminase [Paenibacillaceae bacterium]|jgi:glucosamine-6-phosphate deaminase|nr:glucosamine-6-phosphate deaminase [Paenibacillaceae bacterium]